MRISDWSSDVCSSDLSEPACRGKAYELGGPKVYSFRELMELLLATIGRKRMLVSLPFGLARLQATFLERLPQPLLTRDQVTLLRQDNVVAPDALTLKDLGIAPTAPEAVIETYLDRYRPGGRSEEHTSELQSLMRTSFAVFCLKKKNHTK